MISKWELRTENKMTAFNTVDQSPAQGDGELYDLKVCSLDNGNECVVIISEMMEFGWRQSLSHYDDVISGE